MPRPDLYPADIMDKCQAFSDALNAYLHLADRWERDWEQGWERRYSPSQTRIPAGQPGGGQWTDGGGGGPPSALEMDRPGPKPAVYRPDEEAGLLLHDVAQVLPEGTTRSILQTVPNAMDPIVGMVRGQPVNPPDATRPNMPYVEARDRGELQALLGKAGPDRERHHVVPEHSLGSIPDRSPDPRTIHNSSNLVDLKDKEHTCVTAIQNSNVATEGPLFRDEIKYYPFGIQYSIGLKVIEYCKEKRRREEAGESVESFVRSPRSFLPNQPEEIAKPTAESTIGEWRSPPPIIPFSLPRSGGGSPPSGGSFAPVAGYPMGGGGGANPLLKRTYNAEASRKSQQIYYLNESRAAEKQSVGSRTPCRRSFIAKNEA